MSGCAPIIIGTGVVAVGGYTTMREKTIGESMNDTKIGTLIKSRLYKINPQIYSEISVAVDRGCVLLTGSIMHEEWITIAEEESWKVKGVVAVDNNLVYGKKIGFSTIMKDGILTSEVRTAILCTKDIKSANYKIKTTNKVVYLRGVARTEKERNIVLDTVKRIKGIKKVVSYIVVRQ